MELAKTGDSRLVKRPRNGQRDMTPLSWPHCESERAPFVGPPYPLKSERVLNLGREEGA